MNTSDTPCPDCAVEVGELHDKGCDVARCVTCGEQWISCLCHYGKDEFGELTDEDGIDTEVDEWSGFWPGELECMSFGFYCYWGPDHGEKGWVRCTQDHPFARPDLNTLHVKTVWNPETKMRELR